MPKDRRPSILTVESDETIGRLITGVLKADYDLRSARSGAAALAVAADTLPDLILLDVGLPDIDGFEVCRCIKAHALLAEIPVIFLTSRTSTTDEVGGLEAGGIDYITKPINPTILRMAQRR